MRTFIRYDKNGKIISVAQVTSLGEGIEHPFFLTDETEKVLELRATDPIAKQDCLAIHSQCVVDLAKKRVIQKTKRQRRDIP